MKKLTVVLAALATIAVAAPTIANAQEFGVQVGGDRNYGYRDRGEMHRDGYRHRGGMRFEMGGDRHHDRGWGNYRAGRHHHDD